MKVDPLNSKVIVKPDTVDEKIEGSMLYKATTTERQDRMRQTKGTLVAASDMAFKDQDIWVGKAPEVGQRVMFAEYSGHFYKEEDVEYRIMNDNDIVGLLKE